jgi:VCBS repeat-containing protein
MPTDFASRRDPRRQSPVDGRPAKRRRALFEFLEPRLAPASGSISGVMYNDLNLNGTQDAGDPGIAGRPVFLDLNQDNHLDNGEPSTMTGGDGSYQLTGLQAGSYLVSQVLPSGWSQSAPAGNAEQSVTIAAGTPYTFTFNNLASTSDQHLPAYHENGYTFITSSTQANQFFVSGSSDSTRYAGAPALSAERNPVMITLSRDDGAPFTLTSMDLSTIWDSSYNVTVNFTGRRADGSTVEQAVPIGSQLGFHTVTFNEFTNVTSVTWESSSSSDFHQFRNVVVSTGMVVSAANFGSRVTNPPPPVANNDTYTVNENVALMTGNPLSTSVSMVSQPGDYIGNGRTYAFTPSNSTITGSVTTGGGTFANTVTIEVRASTLPWIFQFQAPNRARLTPGTYNSVSWPYETGSQAGLGVGGDGRGASGYTGHFTVTQAVYDPSGNIISFAASFVQHGASPSPSLSGTVAYQAPTPPPSGVLVNDTDPNGLPLTARVVNGPGHGSVTMNPNGSFTYTPAANYTGPDSFTYVASDGEGTSSPATVNLKVNPFNRPPVAVNENYATTQNQPLSVAGPGILAGTSDPDPNTTLTAKLLTQPSHGSVTLNTDGSFSYTPASNYLGTDSFTYAANDGALNSNIATVTLAVTGSRNAPAAYDDSYAVGTAVLQQSAPGVLANDHDPNGQALTSSVVAGPSNGKLVLYSNGSFTYTPNAGFHGADSFTYQASDGQLSSNPATVNILVESAPVGVSEQYSINEDTILKVAAPGVLANDTQADGHALRAVVGLAPTHGTLTLNTDGSLTYQPYQHYYGTDSFTYYATDDKVEVAPVTDTIRVNPVYYPPVASDDAYTVSVGETLTTTAPVTSLSIQSDPGEYIGGGRTYNYGASDGSYTVTLDNGNAVSIKFVPGVNPSTAWELDFDAPNKAILTPGTYIGAVRYPFQGPGQPGISVSYSSRGNNTLTGTFTVYQVDYDAQYHVLDFDASFLMHGEGLPPALSGRVRYHAKVGQPGVLYNDTEVVNFRLTAKVVAGPSHGTLNMNADGTFNYTPASGFTGTDSFTYQATNIGGTSNVATATINVTAANPPPTAVADTYRMGENQTLSVASPGVLVNDTDPNDKPLHALVVAAPAHGYLTLNADGSFRYTPKKGYAGSDSFQYKVNDGQADSNVVTDTITVSAPPVAVGAKLTVASNGSAAAPLVASDPEQNKLTYVIVTAPVHGTLSGTAPNLTYTPAANYYGSDRFTFRANDGSSDSNLATVTITVVATPTITWPTPADLTYGTPLGSNQLDATASFAGNSVAGTFQYSIPPGTVMTAGPDQTISVTFTPTDTTDFTTASGSVTLNVLKATPTITWSQPSDIAYGRALDSTQLDATASVPGTFTYTPSPGTVLSAGANQTLSVSFQPDDATNYNPASASVAINVNPASSGFDALAGPTIVYGTPNITLSGHLAYGSLVPPGAVTITVGNLGTSASIDPSTGNFFATLDTTNLDAASSPYTISYAYAGTSDFAAASATSTLTVNKADQTIAWSNPADITFGTALDATQLNATVSVPGPDPTAGTLTYATPAGTVLSAGTQTLTVTAAATDNYNAATASVTIHVLKATPTVSWPSPADITYGTVLGADQLDATASVAGTFQYDQSGTVLKAGAGQVLSVTFTPDDATDYNSVTATTTINVAKATPVLTWNPPASIVYGTPLSAAQLDAALSAQYQGVAGHMVYWPTPGTVLWAGANQTLYAGFAPDDTADYNIGRLTTTINVTPAKLTIQPTVGNMGHGDPVPALTYTLSGFVNGDTASVVHGSAHLTTTATRTSAAGFYRITAAPGTLWARNYEFASAPGVMIVHPKVLDVRVHFGNRWLSLRGLIRDLPFVDINMIDVIFSDNVNVSRSSLTLRSLVGTRRQYSFPGFGYNSTTHTATWALPSPLGVDRLLLSLDPSVGARVYSGIRLWKEPVIPVSVLPGDITGDGKVTSFDAQVEQVLVGRPLIWADLDGNGVVNALDVSAARRRNGWRLP